MDELTDLYQQILLDHYRKPRNFGALPGAPRSAEGFNPLCGDRVKIFVDLDGERLRAVSFEGSGCAISTASASMMTEAVRGRTRQEAGELFAAFRAAVTGEAAVPDAERLGKLVALAGVKEFPMRVKCATLAWHALAAALAADGAGGAPISTE